MADALDHLADRLLDAIVARVPALGWAEATLRTACSDLDLHPHTWRVTFPGGALDALTVLARRADTRAAEALAAADLTVLKVRQRIRLALITRLDADLQHEEAVRRAVGRMLLPDGWDLAPRLAWATADSLWRAVGDRSLDENYYSKRVILSGIWTETVLAALSDGRIAAETLIDRRIENVMQFEKWKAACPKPDLSGMINQMAAARYRV